MKIAIHLYSKFHTEKLNEWFYGNEILIDWELPFIPNKGDGFDVDEIIEHNLPESVREGLCWDVSAIDYRRKNGVVMPMLYLRGE